MAFVLILGLMVGLGGLAPAARADDSTEALFQWVDANGGQRACWYAEDCAFQILSEIETHTYAEGTHCQYQEYYLKMAGLERDLWTRIFTWDDAQASLAIYEATYGEIAGQSYGPSSGAAKLFKRLWVTAQGYVGVMFAPNTHEYVAPPELLPEPLMYSCTTGIDLEGPPRVGGTIIATLKSWVPKTPFTYQWYRNGTAIDGATNSAYKIVAADQGNHLTVTATSARPDYPNISTSSDTDRIEAGTIKRGSVSIAGTKKVGRVLKAKISGWTSGVTYSFQWYRSGKKVAGATGSAYRLVKKDGAKKIKVTVTAKKNGYSTTSKASKYTSKIKR